MRSIFRLFYSLLIILLVLSCSKLEKKNTFFLCYTGLNVANGSVAYLWRCSGDGSLIANSGPIGKSIVKHGEFGFMGKADSTCWYKVELGGDEFYYYPEPGVLTVLYGKSLSIPDSMESSNSQSLNLHLYRLKENYSVDSVRKLLFSTISNAVGCSLLKYAVVYPDELDSLYKLSNEQMRRQTPALRELSKMLKNCQLLNTGDSFIDFIADNGGKEIHLSNVVGEEKPVALFFFTNNSQRFPMWNEIETLRDTNPDISILILAPPFSNPSTIQYLQSLDCLPRVMVWKDNPQFLYSARYLYRIYNSNYNYVYLFDKRGKLKKRYPIEYPICGEYDRLQTLLLKRINSVDDRITINYKDWDEYKNMQMYLIGNIDDLYRLLDSPLLKGNLTGLCGYILDDLITSCIRKAPRLINRISKSKDNQQMAFCIQEYITEIRALIKAQKKVKLKEAQTPDDQIL